MSGPSKTGRCGAETSGQWDGGRAQWLVDRSPSMREAIQERLERYPEYRRWLQQFNPEILRAVE